MLNLKTVGRSALVGALALPMMFMTQGCTDEEVAVGLGAVAVVAGAAAIGSAIDHHPHHDHYYPRRPYPPHRPGWGPGRHRFATTLEIEGLSNDAAVDPAVQTMAEKYDLTVDAAGMLTDAFVAAQDGDLQPVRALGLSDADFESLAKMQMISNAGVNSLSAKLEMSTDATRTFVQKLIADVKTQAKDSSSPYWQSCLQAKSWKTPENLSCEKSWWPGCSPETGASLCVVNN